ncbi:MAG: S-methyl-5'-thioinosine phosphorylase [Halanaerobium sp.]
MKYAVIGGTGIYDLLESSKKKTINTKYGEVELDIVQIKDLEVAFLARHGKEHSTPPHKINYRANMQALADLGIKYVFATAAVGSCSKKFAPGDIVVIDDFIDFTKFREQTFYDGENKDVMHFEMDDPYCQNLRKKFYNKANAKSLAIKGSGVYLCTEGPRFETAAEIKMFKKLGGEVIGMTGVPEVVLAKELHMCYASIGIVTNWATGFGASVNIHQIKKSLNENKEKITEIFIEVFRDSPDQNNCNCKDAGIRV